MLCASKTRALEYGRAKNENRCRVVSNSVLFFPTPVEMSLLPLYIVKVTIIKSLYNSPRVIKRCKRR